MQVEVVFKNCLSLYMSTVSACKYLTYSNSTFENSCLLGPEQKNSRKHCCRNLKFPTSTFCSSEAWVFKKMTPKYQCNINTKCTYLHYTAETDSTKVFSLAVRDQFILILLLLIFLLPSSFSWFVYPELASDYFHS